MTVLYSFKSSVVKNLHFKVALPALIFFTRFKQMWRACPKRRSESKPTSLLMFKVGDELGDLMKRLKYIAKK